MEAEKGGSSGVLTAMMSRSHQGMLSPPVKKLPTDSKKRPIFASIDPGWSAESVGIRGDGGAGEEGFF
jgi:hypothetical protein